MSHIKTAERTEIFETLPVPEAVARMALPAVFSQIIVLIYNMADTFFLGRTNNPYMVAGASLILPVFNICLSLAGLAGTGGGALISRLLGERREEEAEKVSSFCILFSAVLAGLFSLLVFCFMNPLLRLLGTSGETMPYAAQYALCVIVFGSLPTVVSNVLSNLIRSTGLSAKAGFGIAAGGIINIMLDPLFMFVLLPKGYEAVGAGAATLLSNCLVCVYFIVTVLSQKEHRVIYFHPAKGMPDVSSVRSVFSVGIPSAAATLLFDIDYVVIGKLMSGWGDTAMAAVGIVLKAERLPLNTGVGICQGMMPLVAYNYAAKNHERMKNIIHVSLAAGLTVGMLSIVFYELAAGTIMQFFINEPVTVALGTDFLRIRCLATPLMFMSFFTVYVFQGFGKGEISLFLGVMRWAVFNIPMLFLLNHLFGMYGIVWSQTAADILTVALSYYVYRSFVRKHFSFQT